MLCVVYGVSDLLRVFWDVSGECVVGGAFWEKGKGREGKKVVLSEWWAKFIWGWRMSEGRGMGGGREKTREVMESSKSTAKSMSTKHFFG